MLSIAPPELRKLVISHRYKLPPRLSPELQNTIRKCLAVDRFDRLNLKSFLSNDPWFNNYGRLDNIFDERIPNPFYHAHDVTEAYANSVRAEDNTRIQLCSQNSKRLHIQDLKEEKRRGYKVPKTVIYHITNASTYFTGTALHSSQQPINLDAQKIAKAELHENILVTLRQVRLQQVHNVNDISKTPMSHLFRKLKGTEASNAMEQQQLRKTSSALNLSQLYQRVAKDHISYFTIQCNIRTGSSTTVISGYSTASTFTSTNSVNMERRAPPMLQPKAGPKRLTKRVSMMFFSNTQPEFYPTHQQQQDEYDPEQEKRSQFEMIRIIRMVCDILGITYYQSTSTQLVCLLTLKNCKKTVIIPPASTQPQQQQQHSLFRSKLFHSSDRLSDMNKRHQQSSYLSNFSTSHDGGDSERNGGGWLSRQLNRLSLNSAKSNLTAAVTNTTHIMMGASSHHALLHKSSHDILNIGRTEQEQQLLLQQQQQQNGEEEEQQQEDDTSSDGFVILSIDVSSIPSTKYNEDGTHVQIVAIRYSKLKGSNKVFKLAKGWIQKILSQNDECLPVASSKSSLKQQQAPPQQQRMMTRSEAEAYFKNIDIQHQQFGQDDNDIIRL